MAVLVAALFHVAAGGGAPSPVVVSLALAFSVPACVLLAGRRLALWRQALSVTASQFLFHALFSLTPAGHLASTSGSAFPSTHMHLGTHLMLTAGAPSTHMTGMLPDDPSMWAGHLTAAVVTILALRYGERTFWGLAARASVAVVRVAALLDGIVAPLSAPAAPVDARPSTLAPVHELLGRMRHRGPPLAAV